MNLPAPDFPGFGEPTADDGLEGLHSELARLRDELDATRARVRQLEEAVDQDPLVPPVLNRRAFERELYRTWSSSRRHGVAACLIYLDVDGLKAVNDTHGHAAGDSVLRHVSRVLMASVRRTDKVGRLGGDEFGILMERTEVHEARRLAEAIRTHIGADTLVGIDCGVAISVSVGVASFDGSDSGYEVIDMADKAMYAARRHRRGVATLGEAGPVGV